MAFVIITIEESSIEAKKCNIQDSEGSMRPDSLSIPKTSVLYVTF